MAASSRLWRLFRIRDYTLLWSGSTVSLLGDGIYYVAIPWEVYRLSNSPAAYGLVGAAFALPQVLFVLVGGLVSDRLNRRTLMIAASVTSAVAIGFLGLLVSLHAEQLWMIIVLVFIYGASQAIFMPAAKALTPSLVPVELLPQATAMSQLLEPVTLAVVGPAVGGILIAAAGTGAAFLLDSATFGVAILTLVLMSGGAVPRTAEEGLQRKASILREAREAIGFVRSTPWIWAGLLASAIANVALTGPLSVLTPYVVKYHLHGTATDLGLIFAVGGVGGVAAALYVALRGTPRRSVTWCFLSWAVATVAMAPIGFTTATWQLMLLSVVIVGGLTMGNLIWFTLMGTLVPNEMLGRVTSLDLMVSFSLTPISNAATGPVAAVAGVRETLVGAGIIGAVVGVVALLVPGARDPEKLKAEPAPTSG